MLTATALDSLKVRCEMIHGSTMISNACSKLVKDG